uniref:Uncharacterized protein n=1 Tax=Capra hircus TaxID=9925 RepID=A0A8C2R0T9_CAPHI
IWKVLAVHPFLVAQWYIIHQPMQEIWVQCLATLCKVCTIFKRGICLHGEGNCTAEEGPGCRTSDMSFFNVKDGWLYNHTQLDCYDKCRAWNLVRGRLKVSSFCCKGQDFCNMYRGRSLHWKSH